MNGKLRCDKSAQRGSSVFRIRPFMKGDREAYVRVHNEGYSTEAWYGSLEKVLKPRDFSELSYDATFLAEANGIVVGLIDLKIRDETGDIENLVVLSEYRRRGIGRALLEKAIEFLNDSVEKIRVETPIQSKKAIEFYLGNGFKHVTNAYLIESRSTSKFKSSLDRNFQFAGHNRYWIPDEKQMDLLERLGAGFSVIGEFKVMIRTSS